MQPIDALWQDFSARILAFIRKRVSNPDDALDLRQEVFVQVWQQLPTLRDERQLLPWMFRITRNTIADHYRRTYREAQVTAAVGAEMPEPEEPQAFEIALSGCLEPFLAQLPEPYRVPLTQFMQGKSQQQIADDLGLSLPGAKSRIQRAREMVKGHFVDCCRFSLGPDGLLHGEHDCVKCGTA